jgi:NADPH-dependent FMN reductase
MSLLLPDIAAREHHVVTWRHQRTHRRGGPGPAYRSLHSIPGGLKNAIDSVWLSYAFRNKPVAAVGYSGSIGGGMRAIEHLAHVFIEVEAVPLRNTVVIPFVRTAFGDNGEPVNPETGIRLQVMLDDLAWWSTALEKARAAGELLPGTLRARAALAATQA